MKVSLSTTGQSTTSSLESSVVFESSEIAQTGEVGKTRDFQFWRPTFDYRYNFADNFRFRGTVRRNVSQLSFSAFAATANDEDRDIDGFAGNPELEAKPAGLTKESWSIACLMMRVCWPPASSTQTSITRLAGSMPRLIRTDRFLPQET